MRGILDTYANADLLRLAPAPSPSPICSGFDPLFESTVTHFSVVNIIFDLLALSAVAALLLLSFLSFAFIFHFLLRSRVLRHLQNFNSLWTVRSLLVLLASLWAVNEMLRLPFLRWNHLYPFLPSLTLDDQAAFCKLHVVLSLGFLEPGFFITVFFLLNVSIMERNPSRMWSIASLIAFSSPLVSLQIFFVYYSPWENSLPLLMNRSFLLSTDNFGNDMVLCTYPIFSWLIFGIFAACYSLAFLVSCWRVMEFVINKGICHRVYILATVVMAALPLQILCLFASEMWLPGEAAYGCVVFLMFLCVVLCMMVAEVLLVLRPIRDSLAAGEELEENAVPADGVMKGTRHRGG